MLDRYVAMRGRTRAIDAGDDYWESSRQTLDVLVDSDAPVDTGLLDEHGTPLFRVRSRAPVGFAR